MRIEANREAAEFVRAKAAVGANTFRALPDELKARAFSVAWVHRVDALERMRELIAKVPEGADWRETREELADAIAPHLGGNEVAAIKKAELLLRTHGYQAWAVGRYVRQVESKEAVPYWVYQTVGDGKVRDDHAALDGKVLPADDPFWDAHYPPWDFNCRCVVAGVTANAVERIKAQELADDVAPAERRVLEGEYLEMARAGRVSRSNGRGFADVRPPKDKAVAAERGSAYAWSAKSVAPDMRRIKERIGAGEYKQMELAMRGLGIKV